MNNLGLDVASFSLSDGLERLQLLGACTRQSHPQHWVLLFRCAVQEWLHWLTISGLDAASTTASPHSGWVSPTHSLHCTFTPPATSARCTRYWSCGAERTEASSPVFYSTLVAHSCSGLEKALFLISWQTHEGHRKERKTRERKRERGKDQFWRKFSSLSSPLRSERNAPAFGLHSLHWAKINTTIYN